jgi:hypothetical protein
LAALVGCQPSFHNRNTQNTKTSTSHTGYTAQPSETPTVSEKHHVTQFPETQAIPKNSQNPKPTSTIGGFTPINPSIVLYKNVVAGDYSVLNISELGRVEYTSFNRLNQVTDHKLGEIDPQDVENLISLIEENGFYKLESEYDIYPLNPDDTMVYEDIYYWLKLHGKVQESKIVETHEKARTAELIQITDVLIKQTSHLTNAPLLGAYIVAGDPDILFSKRNIETQPGLELEEADLNEHPQLFEALLHPYSLVRIDDLKTTEMSKFLKEGIIAKEVIYQDKHYAVLILKGQER